MDTVSQDFYYQTRDEIFAATCQIYLENQYTREQYEAEVINEVRMKFGKSMDNVDVRFELQYIKNLKAHLSKT